MPLSTPLDDLVDLVQQAYPALWFACHVEHRTRKAPHASGLTDRDATVLAHIPPTGIDPAHLAEHLGIAKSSLSAHVARLEALGLVTGAPVHGDRRRKSLQLTDAGRVTRRAASPLDAERVAALLALVPDADRQRAVEGLCLLADAAKRMATPTVRITDGDAT